MKPPTNYPLAKLLSAERLTEIVDIGANPIDGEPPYAPMLTTALCRVTGFEPQEQALSQLERSKGPNERYLPYAVADGGAQTLNVCVAPGMTSLLEPDPAMLALFDVLRPLGEVTERISVRTLRLDDIDEIRSVDFLKIDVQGSELAVFRGGKAKLARAVAIQTEISFLPLYKDQPGIGDIDLELRAQGFIPHCLVAVKLLPIAPSIIDEDPARALNQLVEADIVYVRDFSRPDLMDNEQLKHLALIAHHCYGSFDLARRCVMLLEQRSVLKTGAQHEYLRLVASAK